ncbi:O-antigen ligase family protein [Flavobacterium sp.]|uniref:O-antigen ligase family protein n=1 Tax=Flavobacterium sp. TaxID=239 RepID=UPI0028BD8055|nr:O-antigen ligase family protein [Flavobacterium sp.]
MAIIYNFLKNVSVNIRQEINKNPVCLWVVLLLTTIPLKLGINNVCLIGLIITVVWKQKMERKVSFPMLLPILLYLLMLFSWFWSIDREATLNALSKELFLILIPLIFIFFPVINEQQKAKAILYYGYGMAGYAFFYLLRALIRYVEVQDLAVFFYHEEEGRMGFGLIPQLLNAIHVSVFASLAFFVLLIRRGKSVFDKICLALLLSFIVLLSSKNIIVVFVFLLAVYYYMTFKGKLNLKKVLYFSLFSLIVTIALFGKMKERIYKEIKAETVNTYDENGVHFVSLSEAWNSERFHPNDFFSGTAFRVYQSRIFFELLDENPVFWNGFGLNATTNKLIEKEKVYNLHQGYGGMNFHNQYFQFFAEIGFLGFVMLVLMLVLNLKYAINNKDFIHFVFGILMISLFLTESFLSRQRGVVFFILFYCLFNSYGGIQTKKQN